MLSGSIPPYSKDIVKTLQVDLMHYQKQGFAGLEIGVTQHYSNTSHNSNYLKSCSIELSCGIIFNHQAHFLDSQRHCASGLKKISAQSINLVRKCFKDIHEWTKQAFLQYYILEHPVPKTEQYWTVFPLLLKVGYLKTYGRAFLSSRAFYC